jgi:transcriptional regulator with XRE-family HTH domain
MDNPKIIATRLKVLRLALGFHKANKFTEFVSIADNAWNHFECGRRTPTVKDALKIARKTVCRQHS